MSKIEAEVTKLVKPILSRFHFSLYAVDFSKRGPKRHLSVYIDKRGGITINDCALVSNQLSQALDQVKPDPIPYAYDLDVSSPGAERPLRNKNDFKNSLGKYIHVSLYYPVKRRKIYEGYLKRITADRFVMKINNKGQIKDVAIPQRALAKARLAIKF